MAEYIEREVAIESFRKNLDGGYVLTNDAQTTHILQSIPAADVRPVVTCTDCKYNEREVTDLFGNSAIQCITGLTHRRDWFCADGKKREES